MLRRGLIVAFVLASGAAIAAEAAKEPAHKPTRKPTAKPLPPKPTEDEIDKPGKAAISSPTRLPDDPPKKPGKPGHVNPFRSRRARWPKYAAPCRITYSDKTVVEGYAWRSGNAPIRIFDRAKREHESYFLTDLKRLTVAPDSTTFERDWRWKNQGSSEKVYLEIGYLWSEYRTTFLTADGEKAVGDCSGMFNIVTLDGKRMKWFLYKRHNNRDKPHKKRDEIEPLVYIKQIEFTDDILKKKEEETPGETKKGSEKPPTEDKPQPAAK